MSKPAHWREETNAIALVSCANTVKSCPEFSVDCRQFEHELTDRTGRDRMRSAAPICQQVEPRTLNISGERGKSNTNLQGWTTRLDDKAGRQGLDDKACTTRLGR
jgi:hypothetical protein